MSYDSRWPCRRVCFVAKSFRGEEAQIVAGDAGVTQVRQDLAHYRTKLEAVPGEARGQGDLRKIRMASHNEIQVRRAGIRVVGHGATSTLMTLRRQSGKFFEIFRIPNES